MNRFYILAAMIVLFFPGCKGKSIAVEEDLHKLKSAPQVNVVEVVPLRRVDFPMQVLSNGKLSAARKSSLYFPAGNIVSKINVRNGGIVKEGEIIAELDSREVAAALEVAKVSLEKSRLDYLDILVGLGYSLDNMDSIPEDVLSVAQIKSGYRSAECNYKKAKWDFNSSVIRAPFSGRIADLKLKQWDRADSDAFCSLIDDSSFDVSFSALESEFAFLQIGQKVKVTCFGGQSPSIVGRISEINPTIDNNGQIKVVATIAPSKGLVDGMNVKVIVEKTIKEQLVVPKSAVVIRDNMDVLFRYNKGHADWVYVNIVKANSESYAIEANTDRAAELNENDLIIVKGNLNLAEGSKVEIKSE